MFVSIFKYLFYLQVHTKYTFKYLFVYLVFTQPNLEKDPELRVPPQEIFRVPKPGTADWNCAGDDHRSLYDATMDRLKQRSDQRRVLAKPQFQDFDR
mgnify:CR=1 FL=1